MGRRSRRISCRTAGMYIQQDWIWSNMRLSMSMCDSWWSSIPGFYGDSIRPGFDPDRIQHERWMFLWYPMVLQDAIVTMVLIPNNMMVLTMATKMLSPAGNHGSTWGKLFSFYGQTGFASLSSLVKQKNAITMDVVAMIPVLYSWGHVHDTLIPNPI